ncbi:hypothetical protein F511_13177 [Dorcoceras hygrometricum]|uniref:Uncharacterized protein n=1 Tax=Dorcoceras hygrometricum TaxID=472368 RepID=A0A2Z7BG93_9LAMI|nr:hypothetical protein F511_13177 [Dorcoceras hygrometricum]
MMRMSVNTENNKERYAEFVSGSSEIISFEAQSNSYKRVSKYMMRMSVNTENNKERYAEFVSGSSEINLLHLPFFRHGKDPLEDFDYNGPRCNPLSTTSSRKNS